MSFFPATEPLSTTPDASRYLRALEQAATSPAAAKDPIVWSLDDAASYWVPDWRPPSAKCKTLPADAVMGMVTRAFLIQYRTFPPVSVFFGSLHRLRVSPNGSDLPYQSISAHGYCYAAHMAYAPTVEQMPDIFHSTGLRAVAERQFIRCGISPCEKSESLLGRCLPKADFDNAKRSGILRPTRDMMVSPLSLLVTRLASWRTQLPYIAVRDGKRHAKALYSPYWVHEAITSVAHLVPALLLDADRQLLMRENVAMLMKLYLAMRRRIQAEPLARLRQWTSLLIRTRTEYVVEKVWRNSGARPGMMGDIPLPFDVRPKRM